MVKKILALFLALTMVCLMAACGNGEQTPAGETPAPGETSASGEAPAPKAEKMEIWHYWDTVSMQTILADMVTEYEAQKEGAEIEISYIPYSEYIQKILITAVSGDLPELMIYDGNSTATFAESGILADITDKVNESGIMKNTFEGVIEEHRYKDRLYGFPVYANCLALFYNTDIVKTPPTNMTELYETAKAVTTPEMYGFAMAGGAGEDAVFQFLPFVWSAGEDIDNIAAPGSVRALGMFSQMIAEGIMSKDTINHSQEDARFLFETGRAAMMINGPWNVVPLQENAPDMKWALAMIPKADDGEYASILGGESFGIGKNANVDGIWDFVEYVMQPERYNEFVKSLGQLPADKELVKDEFYQNDPVSKLFVDQLECALPRSYGPQYNEMSKAIQTAISSAMSGNQSAEEALKEAAATIDPLYKAFKGE